MKKKREFRPGPPPVLKAEVSGKHFSLRVVLLAITGVLALFGLGYGLFHLLNTDPGWQSVEYAGREKNVAEEFVLQYNFGATGASASAERKMVSDLYSDLMEDAYLVFSTEEHTESCHNVAYLNDHPNENVTVEPMLYAALEKIEAYNSRYVYLAPAYVEHSRMFMADSPAVAAEYDPAQNAEAAAYAQQLAAFSNDPEMIDLELLGENTVQLHVSQDYLDFAAANELGGFLDFGWTRNAFVVDWVANQMQEKGLTRGYIASYDGFTRNLDGSGLSYSQNVFDRLENELNLPAVMTYEGPMSIVSLRNFAMTELDRWHYYSFGDRIATVFLDPADGMSKSATDNLLSYSKELGCADLLLQLAPIYVADSFDEAALQALTKDGIFSIWGDHNTLCYNDQDVQLTPNPESAGNYQIQYK